MRLTVDDIDDTLYFQKCIQQKYISSTWDLASRTTSKVPIPTLHNQNLEVVVIDHFSMPTHLCCLQTFGLLKEMLMPRGIHL